MRLEIPVAEQFDYSPVSIPVEVIRGKLDGPILFISAAIHGDEINGTEVIRRLIQRRRLLRSIRGTLILVPIVNVFGYNRNVRYLPDRRDLNRSFPGSPTGSLAAQMADKFMNEIVRHCTHGIDLHTGAIHRSNLPQVRACLDDPATRELALSFAMPVVLNSELRDGSLRQAVADLGIPMLLFEGGEALRHDEYVIRAALNGILNVMSQIGMINRSGRLKSVSAKVVHEARSSHWLRAPHSGSLQILKTLGKQVEKGQILGRISDPFGDHPHDVVALKTGIIVGINLLPLVNTGDALFHVATFDNTDTLEEQLEDYEEEVLDTGSDI